MVLKSTFASLANFRAAGETCFFKFEMIFLHELDLVLESLHLISVVLLLQS